MIDEYTDKKDVPAPATLFEILDPKSQNQESHCKKDVMLLAHQLERRF